MRVIYSIILLVFISSFSISQKIIPVADATNGYLLGGFIDNNPVGADSINQFLKANQDYNLFTLNGFIGKAEAPKPEKMGPPCDEILIVNFPVVKQKDQTVIAIGGSWNAYPKVLKITDTKQKVYLDIIREQLISKGIKNPKLKITQAIRTDLENDGVEEVLITATNYPNPYGEETLPINPSAGSYSLILLRKIIAGKVENIPIASEIYPEAKEGWPPNEYKVLGILDVDGDGKMEIIISCRYYEGNQTIIYRIDGKEVVYLMSSGCGV